MNKESLDPRRWAKFYASMMHGNQKYAGHLPYTHHLAAVERVLVRYGVTDPDLLDASWLHDIIEDAGVKRNEIAEMFGERVATLVFGVTNEPGENRKIRSALTYPKIRSSADFRILKLADRIANVEQGGKLVEMYRKEYADFRRALYPYDEEAGETELSMWKRLDFLMDPN